MLTLRSPARGRPRIPAIRPRRAGLQVPGPTSIIGVMAVPSGGCMTPSAPHRQAVEHPSMGSAPAQAVLTHLGPGCGPACKRSAALQAPAKRPRRRAQLQHGQGGGGVRGTSRARPTGAYRMHGHPLGRPALAVQPTERARQPRRSWRSVAVWVTTMGTKRAVSRCVTHGSGVHAPSRSGWVRPTATSIVDVPGVGLGHATVWRDGPTRRSVEEVAGAGVGRCCCFRRPVPRFPRRRVERSSTGAELELHRTCATGE